ncbi:TlpA disulfide reductase family protein [Streptosporangium sp. KLBMP 9127]|nr:TlpA family protein disulfide reductase [Streptosporangium sp. KLBMP 9127]
MAEIAVVAVGVLSLGNLLLILLTIRAFRSAMAKLQESIRLRSELTDVPYSGLRLGAVVDATTAVDVAGHKVAMPSPTGSTLVGFFFPGCAPCEVLLPEFLAYSKEFTVNGGQVISAVFQADTSKMDRYVSQLREVSQVVVEDFDGNISKAFDSKAYPMLYVIDSDGVVIAAGTDMRSLTGELARA